MPVPSATLNTLLALAAWLLGISLFVQVVQELYKYVTSSKSRAYSIAILDFLGPIAKQIVEPGVSSSLMIRGPFQFRRLQPRGRLLPLNKETLVAAVERTGAAWHRMTRGALETEVKLQNGVAQAPSVTFLDFLAKLARGTQEEPGSFDASEMAHFLKDRNVAVESASNRESQPTIDASKLLAEWKTKYASEALKVEDHFDQLMQNYEYSYSRRNLRQTFVLALLLALWCDFAFDTLYNHALNASTEEARNAATIALGDYERIGRTTAAQRGESPATLPTSESDKATPTSQSSPTANAVRTSSGSSQGGNSRPPLPSLPQNAQVSYLPAQRLLNILELKREPNESVGRFMRHSAYYLFGCLITAVLICFGAPFWNAVTKSLLHISQKNDPTEAKTEKA
jgi:hypothetical protein